MRAAGLRSVLRKTKSIEVTLKPPARHPALTQTNWELVRDAASESSTARVSLEALTRRAWPAIFAFIRASGRSADEATELTQGFFCDVFLARSLVAKADEERGRFRTLLLGSVRNYLNDMHRRKSAVKRKPEGGGVVVAFDALAARGAEPASGASSSPERAFNTRFVAGMIRSASEQLQRTLLDANDEVSWEIFRLRVLAPALDGTSADYSDITARFGLGRGACAAKLLIAKRKFAAILMDELRQTVADPKDLHDEVRELLSTLNDR